MSGWRFAARSVTATALIVSDTFAGAADESSRARVETQGTRTAESRYETVVRARLQLERTTPDDPAAFASRLRVEHAPPGEQLSDLLRLVPGIRLRDHGPGQAQTFSARGAEAHQVAIVMDGIRLGDPGRDTVDLSLIDPHQLSTIEVRRSGGSARLGSGALGGALVLTTRELEGRPRGSASVGYGAWQSLMARVRQGGSAGKLRYLGSAIYKQSAGDFAFVNDNGQAVRRINNRSRQGEALIKLDAPLGARWRAWALNHTSVAVRGAPGPSMNQSPSAEQRDVRNMSALRFGRRGLFGAPGKATLGLSQRYSRFAFDDRASDLNGTAEQFSVGGDVGLRWRPRDVLRLDGRLELAQEWLFDERTGDRQRLAADGFVSAALDLGADHLTIVPAVRLIAASRFVPAAAPKVGVVVRPLAATDRDALRGLELVANAGRGYRLPSFQELFLRVEGFQPNPELAPEDAWTVDAGLRWQLGRAGALEAAYFARWLANTILYAPSGSFIVRPDNYSEAQARGVEAAIELTPGLGLAAQLAYTYTRTRFSELVSPADGEVLGALALPGHPRHRLTASLAWAGARAARRWSGFLGWLEGLVLRLDVEAQSSMPLDRFNSPALAEEARALLSLSGTYSYHGLTVDVRLRNLLDKRDAVDALGFPLAPLGLFVSSSLDW